MNNWGFQFSADGKKVVLEVKDTSQRPVIGSIRAKVTGVVFGLTHLLLYSGILSPLLYSVFTQERHYSTQKVMGILTIVFDDQNKTSRI